MHNIQLFVAKRCFVSALPIKWLHKLQLRGDLWPNHSQMVALSTTWMLLQAPIGDESKWCDKWRDLTANEAFPVSLSRMERDGAGSSCKGTTGLYLSAKGHLHKSEGTLGPYFGLLSSEVAHFTEIRSCSSHSAAGLPIFS
ncbi:hypothetical protein P5G65_11295 [Paenibacillus chondroitinus]|uniref:Uncharacterized protein n=1 Tax=Paenibacillus chondroitinus TaxID=59842 RepID=A0ABU6D9R8_9BACL|nr:MULTISPECIES: hypothetical protein [Paenibacillus]MCY9656835.1 hypothetical protein [Paenibacillus anseongense]MEB4794485.1 hypothetical protein [Paenibacillus chondroitinus]